MAETDFSIFGDSAANVSRGVTAAEAKPNGGGNFVFGFNSNVDSIATVGLYVAATNFGPLKNDSGYATGGSVRAAMKRGVSTAPIGFSAGIFINLQGVTENDYGYVLGLSNNDPHEIVLAKVALSVGLDPTATTILRKSSATFLPDTYHHLKLDSIVNPNGDVVLKCFSSDLSVNTVDSPIWVAITGMADFIDDALGVASYATGHSMPLSGGYGGYFFNSEILGARAYFDQFELHRQK